MAAHIAFEYTRRAQILAFIAEYATDHHNAPSTLEIARAMGISQQCVYNHMVKLIAERRLMKLDGKWKIPAAHYIAPDNLN